MTKLDKIMTALGVLGACAGTLTLAYCLAQTVLPALVG